MRRFLFGFCVLILAATTVLAADGVAFQKPENVTYEVFLKMRSEQDVVVLDAAQLEKYFMVVPEDMAKQGKGISQKQLDALLVSLIPAKETKVVLYCYQNFMRTRNMPASSSVAISLEANGYKNIYALEYLWMNGRTEEQAKSLGEKEIIPYAKKIPENYPVENKSK